MAVRLTTHVTGKEKKLKTITTDKLRQIIESECKNIEQEMLYKDSFSTGCFLHKIGHKKTGRKLCYGVLDSLGFDRRKTYFSDLLTNLENNEDAYNRQLRAHLEINNLFQK